MAAEASYLHRAGIVIVCVTAVLLCLPGMPEAISHPDQMAFQPLFKPGLAPFNPGWFEKPPFHTYFNYFLSVWPIRSLANAMGIVPETAEHWQILWSKLLQILLHAAATATLYRILLRTAGTNAALIIAALFATSAGLVAHAHFLTADIPVLFWMLLAFLFCQRLFESGRWRDYAAAGLITGIAAAAKYNGIGVGIAIPVAHMARYVSLRQRPPIVRWALAPKLILALGLVVAGFLLANPFALLDFRTFYGDFSYNLAVAPVYEGQTGHSYGRFFVALAEAIGFPTLLCLSAGALYSLARSLAPSKDPRNRAAMWMSAAVLLLYYAKFAPFPRLENRFVLPIAPYLLILAAPALDRALRTARTPTAAAVAVLLAYNVTSSIAVGERFRNDPRARARLALTVAVPAVSKVESDIYTFGLGPHYACCETQMPFVTGRERLFAMLFAGNATVSGTPEELARAERQVSWFTPQALAAREPCYIVTDSNYYARFVDPGPRRELYPDVERYFSMLLAEKLGYRIVLDLRAPPPAIWMYPREIDFLQNRLVVLRSEKSGAGSCRTGRRPIHRFPAGDRTGARPASP